MKKLLITLCVLMMGVMPIFAQDVAVTITVYASAVNVDGTTPVGGTVKLTSKASETIIGSGTLFNPQWKQDMTVETVPQRTSSVQMCALGKKTTDFIVTIPGYYPIITLTPTASEGYYVEGIYQVVNEEETLVGFAEFEITSSSDATYTYKVKFAKLPDGVPPTIISSTSLDDLYTGTEGLSTTFPYKPKWQVNLASTFDESGKALFDQLFIFGKTTFNGSASASTSVTPCYKFTKSDENTYRFSDYVPNVNISGKASMFNITATEGMKIYATGWCPSGSCGYRPEDNGLFYIKGAAGVSVHLYIEDCYMYLRAHTKSGTFSDIRNDDHLYKETFIPGNDPDKRPSVPGIASSVVFECTSTSANSTNPFKPYVHVRGNNLMYGHRGTPFNLDISSLAGILGMDINPIIGQYCAALSVKIGNNGKGSGIMQGTATSNSYTTLTLDDKWPTSATGGESTHTNGYLKFEKEWYASPSIDLGNKNTVLNFDGGRFELSPNLPTQAQYINNLTICYRTGFVDLLGGVYVMSGVGGESTAGTVNINDGSVYVTPFNAMHTDISKFLCLPGYFEDAVIDATGKYAESRILRCPANTYVTGGSHPGDIRACDDQNASGNAPKDKKTGHLLKQVKIPTSNFTNGQLLTAGQFASVFPSDSTIECGYPSDLCTVSSPHEQTYAQYYSSISYGANSIAPQDGYIYLWLPGHGKHSVTYVPWQVFFPETTMGISDYTQTLGEVDYVLQEFYADGKTRKKKAQNVLYVDIDDNMKDFLTNGYGTQKYPAQVPASTNYVYVTPEGDSENIYHKSITNTEPYTVYNSVCYVTTAVADEWMLFCPPFDVTNVYIIETANEELLAKKAAEEDRDAALLIQSKYNLDAMTIVGANMVSNDKAIKFWEHYSGFNKYVQAVRMYKNSGKTDNTDMTTAAEYYADDNGISWSGAIGSVVNYTKLVHLSKTDSKYNYDQAHYYLYKQGAGNFTEWGEDSEGSTFLRTNWELADANITGVNGTTCVMKKGEVYAMQFPYCPGCNDGTKWDYWTGKMLVFEGVGENTIAGTSAHTGILSNELANGLHGNYTLADIQKTSNDDTFNGVSDLYFNSTDILNQFSNSPPEQLNPGDAFLKLTAPMSMPGKRIKSINAETGAITWEEDNSNDGTTTSTPTISGNRQMMVYTIEGGVGIIPVTAQEVSIYNAAGQLITSQYLTEETHIPLSTGIYLICGANERAKAVVR